MCLNSSKGNGKECPEGRENAEAKPINDGTSKEEVPVLIARDRNGNIVDGVLKGHSYCDIASVLAVKISASGVLSIDGGNPLFKFAESLLFTEGICLESVYFVACRNSAAHACCAYYGEKIAKCAEFIAYFP